MIIQLGKIGRLQCQDLMRLKDNGPAREDAGGNSSFLAPHKGDPTKRGPQRGAHKGGLTMGGSHKGAHTGGPTQGGPHTGATKGGPKGATILGPPWGTPTTVINPRDVFYKGFYKQKLSGIFG